MALLWIIGIVMLAVILVFACTLLVVMQCRRSSVQIRVEPSERRQQAHATVELADTNSMAGVAPPTATRTNTNTSIPVGMPVSGSGRIAPPTPVATVATVVAQPVVAQPAGASGGGNSIEQMQLAEMVDLLSRHLGVNGNMTEVVKQAAETLGIEQGSMPLPELARKCVESLGLLMPGAASNSHTA